MDDDTTAFVGLDVHKDSIAVAAAEPGRRAPRFLGTVGPQLGQLLKALSPLGEPRRVHLAYEAGPCGYGLARHLRAGELTPVTIPDARDEAIRDLSRAREDAVRARLKARQQLKAMLLRHGRNYGGKTAWTQAHERYLAKVSFSHPAQDIAYAEYRSAVREADNRVERITTSLRDEVASWRFAPVVSALGALRGIDFITAVTIVAELGDLARFAHPKELMSYLGLVPSEYSTGESRVQGAITKTGNGHARRVLIESAWNYRCPARLTPSILARNEGQSPAVRDIAWRAQLRLCARYRRLDARGVNRNKICVAIARELVGFVWDVACHVPVP